MKATEELVVPQEYTTRDWISGFIRIAVCVFCLLLVVGCEKQEEKPRPSPPEVLFTEVLQQNVPITNEWVAQLNGPVNADITPKVQGYLLRQNYQNGYLVRKGQLLFELDPRQYQAALEEAKAQVAVAEANLARVTADVERDTPLAAQNAIPQKQLDNDLAFQQSWKSQVLAAKANQQNAELNLAWTKIYSPIDGIAGVANSQVGDLVGTTTKMATVSQVNPIWAYFNVSESSFLNVAPQITEIISGKASALKSKQVEYIQANNELYPHKGKFVYVNRQVGTQTGTIQMAVEFPNPDAVLRPGGFGSVRVATGVNEGALLVPQPAVIEVQTDYQVLVLTPENKVVFRPVKVGERVGPNWIVTEGLKPGERVVVEGVQKVQMFAAAAPELMKTGGVPVIAKPWAPPATQAAAGSN
ncbi:MAG TPA: efflux RND transporter periplasmic adaptor subunit [Bryocella sp.]|nr:efflux RND transporter periplasmic adaptor subunit [Bryocella sp.]